MKEWLPILIAILGIALGAVTAIMAAFAGRKAREKEMDKIKTSLKKLVDKNLSLQAALQAQEKKPFTIVEKGTVSAISNVIEDRVYRSLSRQGISPTYNIDYMRLGKKIGSIERFYDALQNLYLNTNMGLNKIADYAITLTSSVQPALLFIDLVSSTSLKLKLGIGGLGAYLEKVRSIIYEEASTRQGSLVSSLGDGFILVFQDAKGALETAKAINHRLAAGIDTVKLSTRMAVDLADKDISKAVENISKMERMTEPNKISLSSKVLSKLEHVSGLETEKKSLLIGERQLDFYQLSQVD